MCQSRGVLGKQGAGRRRALNSILAVLRNHLEIFLKVLKEMIANARERQSLHQCLFMILIRMYVLRIRVFQSLFQCHQLKVQMG